MDILSSRIPEGFDCNFALDVAASLAQAAYKVMHHPDSMPAMPDGYQMTSLIRAREGALAEFTKSRNKLLAHVSQQGQDIFGLIGKNILEKTAFVAFRGTETLFDWKNNIEVMYEPYAFVKDAGDVHFGFQSLYTIMRESVITSLSKICGDCEQVFVTGHSLGGALALLSALDIAFNTEKNLTPKLITFAGPRVGLFKFHQFFNHRVPSCYRVVASGDIVPHLPLFVPPFVYEHVGDAVNIDGGQDDPIKAHSLTESYIPGLKNLI
jgi:predicted lipase